MADSNDKETVVVNIGGKDFKIKGDAGQEFLRDLAAYVDGKIKEIKEKTDVVDMQSLAVLASLNIAEELHNLRQEKAHAAASEQQEKLATLTRQADSYLRQDDE
jgi:cell division protein ZapA (FtsZ GTPase activity inhibitor)